MAEQVLDRQRPIESVLKTHRFLHREPENPIRWAYASLLRRHDKTKQFFPEINPYAEVYSFREDVYGIYTESLDGMGDPWIYVINGKNRAMVIDTGFGVGNLKGLVQKLVGNKELIIVNTHAHFDHSYGNFQFDQVYCHENEASVLKAKMRPDIWDYLFDKDGRCIWTEFDRSDIIRFREYEVIGVPNGYIWDLGDKHEIELIFLPGHTGGHAGFLDRKDRIFYAGDDACFGAVGIGGGIPDDPYGKYATVEGLRNELIKICARSSEFDAIFPGHGLVDMGSIVLENVLEACEEVLENPECYDRKRLRITPGNEEVMTYGRRIYESGYLEYNDHSVYMNRIVEFSGTVR